MLFSNLKSNSYSIKVLHPALGVNIKNEVLAKTLRDFKTLIEKDYLVVMPFSTLTGSAIEIPKIAKQFPNITFVVVLLMYIANDVANYLLDLPPNFHLYSAKVVSAKIYLNHISNRKMKSIVMSNNGYKDRVRCSQSSEFMCQAIPEIAKEFGIADVLKFKIGIENPLFMNNMIQHFEYEFANTVNWEGIENILMVSGTANTCESMCIALRRMQLHHINVISVKVGQDINTNRTAFDGNVEFHWSESKYTTPFSFDMLDTDLAVILEELFAAPQIACDPYCSKMMIGFNHLRAKYDSIADMLACSMLIYVRNGLKNEK